MNKKEIRKKYKNLRALLSKEERDALSIKIANQALKLDIWDHEYYHIFLPIERLHEINTEYLLSILNGKDKNIIISKSDFERQSMQHFLLMDNTRIITNELGIPEPENGIEIDTRKIEVVIIPLLAYDIIGNRVGYGKGFYDRFLKNCNPNVLKIGVSFFEPEINEIPTNSTDVPLEYCISSKKSYKF